jgi:hypothetical protein
MRCIREPTPSGRPRKVLQNARELRTDSAARGREPHAPEDDDTRPGPAHTPFPR